MIIKNKKVIAGIGLSLAIAASFFLVHELKTKVIPLKKRETHQKLDKLLTILVRTCRLFLVCYLTRST